MKFNVNEKVRVRLTEKGRNILRNDLIYPRLVPSEKDGWSEWQLWELMSVFGGHMFNGCDVPFETTIEILVPEPVG